MKLSLLLLALVFGFMVNEVSGSWWPSIRLRRTRPKITLPKIRVSHRRKHKITAVKNFYCRLRHHRTLVDSNNKYVRCARRCPLNYRELYSVYWGHYCKIVVIPEGCRDEYCTSCKPSYKWMYDFDQGFGLNTKTKCVKKCPKGYKETGRTCEECLVSFCDRCIRLWKCSKCSQGFALQRTIFGSTVCVVTCSYGYTKVNEDGMEICVSKWKVITTVEPVATTTLITKTPVIATTKMKTKKTATTLINTTKTPVTTKKLGNTTSSTIVTTVTTTTTPTTTTTIPTTTTTTATTTTTIPTTTTTTPTTTTTTPTTTTTTPTTTTKEASTTPIFPNGCKDMLCTACTEGYLKFITPFSNSTCINECPTGYTALGTICVACSDRRCASCKVSIGECNKCLPGYSIMMDSLDITTECVRYCPPDHTKENIDGVDMCIKEELKECPVTNCKTCAGNSLSFPSQDGCHQCEPGFVLFRGALNDHCYTSCPPQYYPVTIKPTNTTICAKCKMAFCNKCSTSDTCNECIEPLVLDQLTRKCKICEPFFTYNYDVKKCIAADINRPEIDENLIYGPLPFP